MRNRLRELRAEAGWSQAALGEKLGVSRQTINAIETEDTTPACHWPSKLQFYSNSQSKRSSSTSQSMRFLLKP